MDLLPDPRPKLTLTDLDRERILAMPVDGVVHSECLHESATPMFSVYSYPLCPRHYAKKWKDNFLIFFMRGNTLCTIYEVDSIRKVIRHLEQQTASL